MPKIVITKETMPRVLDMIAMWEGKLTWKALCEKLGKELGTSVSRHTLLSYPAIVEAFQQKKQLLRDVKENPPEQDVSVEFAKRQIARLEAKVRRLEADNQALTEQFVRWQYNLSMMPGVDMAKLNAQLEKPLPGIER